MVPPRLLEGPGADAHGGLKRQHRLETLWTDLAALADGFGGRAGLAPADEERRAPRSLLQVCLRVVANRAVRPYAGPACWNIIGSRNGEALGQNVAVIVVR
jgi:hypothetical protein